MSSPRMIFRLPVPVTQASRQRHYDTSLRDIDASLAAVQEIEFRLPRVPTRPSARAAARP